MYFPQLPELADFAKAIPDLPIILNHIGGLVRTGPYANKDDEVLATWRRGIAAVAACPNVIDQARRHRHAPHRIRLAFTAKTHRLRGAGGVHQPLT